MIEHFEVRHKDKTKGTEEVGKYTENTTVKEVGALPQRTKRLKKEESKRRGML